MVNEKLDEDVLVEDELVEGLKIPADALVCRCPWEEWFMSILLSRRGELTSSRNRWNMTESMYFA